MPEGFPSGILQENAMKRIIILLLLTLLLACVPTPEEDYVINKAEARPANSAQPDTDSETTQPELSALFPSHWTEDFTPNRPNLTVSVDADVDAIGREYYNVYRLKPVSFTPEQVDTFYRCTLGGAKAAAYRHDSHGNNYPFIGQLDAEARELIGLLNLSDEELIANGIDPDAIAGTRAYWQSELNELKKRYSEAVEPEFIEDFAAFSESRDDMTEGALFSPDTGDEIGSFSFSAVIKNDDPRDGALSMEIFEDALKAPSEAFPNHTGKQEESVALGETLLEQLGLYDFTLNRIDRDPGTGHFILYYTRSFDGIPYSSAIADTPITVMDGPTLSLLYERYWRDEQLQLTTGDYGIQICEWISSCVPGEAVRAEQALPFERIQELFRRDIGYVADYDATYGERTLDMKVDQIQLGYKRVPVKDHVGSYEVVPVWTFSGAYYVNGSKTAEYSGVLLVLNAIDGSIVG